MPKRQVAVVGGGAAGFFAAIACAESNPGCEVTLYEATAHILAKVIVSGGGRCNVTHSCFEPRELIRFYPRGGKELLGSFHRFQPRDTVEWFSSRGVELKREDDGRMFPVTDDSHTIADSLIRAAEQAGVQIRIRCGVLDVNREMDEASPTRRFRLTLSTAHEITCDRLLLATGGNKSAAGFVVAEKLGHFIEPPIPSLFTFHIDDDRLKGLAGVAVPEVILNGMGFSLREQGPVLITHWGLSGPVVLRFSAWGAREIHARDYRFTLRVNWAGERSTEAVRTELASLRTQAARRKIITSNPFGIPHRLWERLVTQAGVGGDAVWASLSNQLLNTVAQQLTQGEFMVSGKSLNKEEFVTCGGVRLSEVDLKSMQSRLCPGLYIAGEMLDIDGITGGFNFQAAWTTGWLAGKALAAD